MAIFARTREAVAEAADELAASGAHSIGLACDVTDRAQVHTAVEEVVARLGPVTILVNHAGVFRHAPSSR